MYRKFYKEDNQAIPSIKFELDQPLGFTLITDLEEIKRQIVLQYDSREIDGNSYLTNFTADLYLSMVTGINTPEESFALEHHISEIYEDLANGWWMTAQSVNSSLALSGIYTQEMKDKIQSDIDLYVSENY